MYLGVQCPARPAAQQSPDKAMSSLRCPGQQNLPVHGQKLACSSTGSPAEPWQLPVTAQLQVLGRRVLGRTAHLKHRGALPGPGRGSFIQQCQTQALTQCIRVKHITWMLTCSTGEPCWGLGGAPRGSCSLYPGSGSAATLGLGHSGMAAHGLSPVPHGSWTSALGGPNTSPGMRPTRPGGQQAAGRAVPGRQTCY